MLRRRLADLKRTVVAVEAVKRLISHMLNSASPGACPSCTHPSSFEFPWTKPAHTDQILLSRCSMGSAGPVSGGLHAAGLGRSSSEVKVRSRHGGRTVQDPLSQGQGEVGSRGWKMRTPVVTWDDAISGLGGCFPPWSARLAATGCGGAGAAVVEIFPHHRRDRKISVPVSALSRFRRVAGTILSAVMVLQNVHNRSHLERCFCGAVAPIRRDRDTCDRRGACADVVVNGSAKYATPSTLVRANTTRVAPHRHSI